MSADAPGDRRLGPRGGDGLAAFLGMRWDAPDAVRLTVRPELVNDAGRLLGAVGFALVDYGMAAVVYDATTIEEYMATTTIAITYVGSATAGDVVCTTRLEHRGRRTAALTSQLRRDDGRLLATAIGSFAIYPAAELDRRGA